MWQGLSNVSRTRIVGASVNDRRSSGHSGRAKDGEETPPMQAYVLVQTDSERRHVAELLRTLPGVVYAEDVSGPYDALALARSDADGDGFDGVLDRIRMLPGVLHALAAPLTGAVELAEPAATAALAPLATSDAA